METIFDLYPDLKDESYLLDKYLTKTPPGLLQGSLELYCKNKQITRIYTNIMRPEQPGQMPSQMAVDCVIDKVLEDYIIYRGPNDDMLLIPISSIVLVEVYNPKVADKIREHVTNERQKQEAAFKAMAEQQAAEAPSIDTEILEVLESPEEASEEE